MRWRELQEGDRRVKTYFALLPAWSPKRKNWVWLETVTMEQEYGWVGNLKPRRKWVNVREVAA